MKRNHDIKYNRREFLEGLTMTASVLTLPLLSLGARHGQSWPQEKEETGGANGPKKKLGVALVGLGQYSTHQLAPALQETQNCYLAGIVTGTPAKAKAWKSKYNIPEKNIYNYENFDQIVDNESIDIVYIVLPNGMHAEYTIRAARAKKHVISEKPMATSVEDAEQMIGACRTNNVKLGIGYRLQYDPFHKRVMELGQKKIFGKVRHIQAKDSSEMTSGNPDLWRLNKKLAGGGPLMDLGIYCVQGAIYTLGRSPISVTAQFGKVTRPTFFDEVEQSISWQMQFENGVVAECNSSYAKDENLLAGTAEKGWWRLSPAFSYEGKEGATSEGKMELPNIYEQVAQMDAQAEDFRNNQTPIASGEMGLRDVKILMAIYESAQSGGKKVPLHLA